MEIDLSKEMYNLQQDLEVIRNEKISFSSYRDSLGGRRIQSIV